MNSKTLTASLAAAALIAPTAAQAHVTLQPNEAPAGGYTVENVRVPNETDDAITTKVDVKFPHGFAGVSYQAAPGWKVTVSKAKLARPIKTDDGEVTEEVSRIVWTASQESNGIRPGQFRDFPVSVQIPEKANAKLTFKALQTYSNGDIVRWIGAPSSDTPAPQITVLAAEKSSAHDAAPVAAAPAAGTVKADSGSGKASKGLAIAALILGAIGVLLGGAGLARRRA